MSSSEDLSPEEIQANKEYEETRRRYRMPLSCPACGSLFYNWDKQFYYKYGVCADCSIDYIEDRDLPHDLIRDWDRLLAYVKQKISEKEKKEINKE